MDSKEVLSEIGRRSRSQGRRRFLQAAGIGGAGVVGAGIAGRVQTRRVLAASSGVTDADILNFALNLEYLEAEFYTYAVTGGGISAAGVPTSGTGNSGTTTGGMQVSFPDHEHHDIFVNVMHDEQAHVKLLHAALGSAAVAEPAINLNALGIGFGSFIEFINVARLLEDVGINAYSGAAPLLSSKTYLAVAARILAAEAEHSGNIREQVILFEGDDAPSGKAITALGVGDVPPTDGMYFSVNYEGLVFPKTPAQVLAIVYNGAGKTSGAFYTNGVNGAVTSS